MAETVLAKKLLVKPEHRAAILNAPEGELEQQDIKAETSLGAANAGSLDFIQLFVKNAEELKKFLPDAQKALKSDGLLWVCYPKGGSKTKTDLNRDILRDEMKQYGLAGVAMVSIDAVWSAMRFRPLEKVGK